MTRMLGVIIRVYDLLLRLYPGSFRNEFEEQMLLDFSDMAMDAEKKGKSSLVLFFLREVLDFPVNLLRVHFKQGYVFKILRSQPVNSGLRGAIGFSVGFAAAAIAIWGFSSWLFSAFEPTVSYLSVWIYDTFQNEDGTRLLSGVLSILSWALTGIVFGLLFALLLGNRTKFLRYMIAGALGWTIPTTVSVILSDSFGWPYFLSESQTRVLDYSIYILIGVFLSAAFIVAESDWKEPLRYLVAGVIIYPFGTYLFIRLLFYLWLEITPWFFISLMVFMIMLISGVIAVVMLSNRKMLYMVIAGAVGYLVLSHAAFYVSYDLLHFPSPPLGVGITPDAFIVYQFYGMFYEAIFGALFGLVLGLILGYLRKNIQPQLATGT